MNHERIQDVRIQMPVFDRLAGLRNDIQSITKFAVAQTAKYIPLHETTIRMVDDPKSVIPGHAHGGWTHSADSIRIALDPHFPHKEKLLYEELPRTISHELHHAVRLKALPDAPRSLGTMLIFEGLATLFETEVWGGEPSKWSTAVTDKQLQELLELFKTEKDSLSYNHERWFFGKGNLPRWAGYSLGVYLVKEYLKLHPNESSGSLVTTSAETILTAIPPAR